MKSSGKCVMRSHAYSAIVSAFCEGLEIKAGAVSVETINHSKAALINCLQHSTQILIIRNLLPLSRGDCAFIYCEPDYLRNGIHRVPYTASTPVDSISTAQVLDNPDCSGHVCLTARSRLARQFRLRLHWVHPCYMSFASGALAFH